MGNLRLKETLTSNANYIAVIDCLTHADYQSGRRHYEDVTVYVASKLSRSCNNKVDFFTCNSISELESCFEGMFIKFLNGNIKPMLFIHAHGDKDNGLSLPDKSFMSWYLMIELYNKIMDFCGGHLTVIAGFCHSLNIIKYIEKSRKSPFSFYYGYESDVSAGDVEREMDTISRSLINNGGESLRINLSQLKIKMYSEYDHIKPLLLSGLLMISNPSLLSKFSPDLSIGNVKKRLSENHIGPRGGLDRSILNNIRDGSYIKWAINDIMHDTDRKDDYLRAIDSYIQDVKKGR
ncbi:hypothetical protein [Tatumella terrea]|uniref:Uncharacterized protein n=1 Tax=Tatumella terrea TaxID=419007 RepID=A0ABW1VUN4_9GAMM